MATAPSDDHDGWHDPGDPHDPGAPGPSGGGRGGGPAPRRRSAPLVALVLLLVAAVAGAWGLARARESAHPAEQATQAATPSDGSLSSAADPDPAPHAPGTRTFAAPDPGSITASPVDPVAVAPLPTAPVPAWTVSAQQILDAREDPGFTIHRPVIERVSASDDVAVVRVVSKGDGEGGPGASALAGLDLATGAIVWARDETLWRCEVQDDDTTFCSDEAWQGAGAQTVEQLDTRTGQSTGPVSARGGLGHDVVAIGWSPGATPADRLVDITATSHGALRWRTTIRAGTDLWASVWVGSVVPVAVRGAPDLLAVPVPGSCSSGDGLTSRDGRRGVRLSYVLDRATGRLVGTLDGAPVERVGDRWSVLVPQCGAGVDAPVRTRWTHLEQAPRATGTASDAPDGTADDGAASAVSWSLADIDGTVPDAPVRVGAPSHGRVTVTPPGGSAWTFPAGAWAERLAAPDALVVQRAHTVQVLDVADGRVRWKISAHRGVGLVASDGSRAVLGALEAEPGRARRLTAYDLRTGAVAWTYEAQGGVCRRGTHLFDVAGDTVSLLR